MNRPIRSSALLPLALMALGCGDPPTQPDPGVEPPETEPPARLLGLMEITLTGITEAEGMTASARSITAGQAAAIGPATGGGFTAQSLDPVEEDGRSGIQLERLSTGSFTAGERGADGERYFSATFRVRNASSDGVAYTDPLENLTFLAVDTDGTIEQTPVSQLRRFDGTAASASLAQSLLPTGWARRSFTGLGANEPDVLQALTEAEAGAVAAPADVATVFPYGFVTRGAHDDGRELPGDPDEDVFDGVVTFAFRLPLQATAADDPFEISVIVLAVSDTETRITQALEEQTVAGRADVEARASALGATTVTLLPGGSFGGGEPTRRICRVRTAGSAGSPTAHLVDTPLLQSLAPDPYAADGSASFIDAASRFEATFDAAVSADHETFVVHGFQRGRAFVGEGYSGDGTSTATSPVGGFAPGEEVEVTVTGELGCEPLVARYRVAGGAGDGKFAEAPASPFPAGSAPNSLAVGDVDGDGNLDLATTNDLGDLTVLLGDGSGGFVEGAGSPFDAGSAPHAIALGDMDGDGDLDIVVADMDSDDVTVLLGDGGGGFGQPAVSPFRVGEGPRAVTLGDMDGDGNLDVVAAARFDNTVTALFGDGDGGFGRAAGPFGVGRQDQSVALGDVDGDGNLDILTLAYLDGNVTVLLGHGGGTFREAAGSPFPISSFESSIALGDVNGDGDPDVLTANDASNHVTVLLGDGSGGFTPGPGPFDVGVFPADMKLADVDGDGDLDVITANAVSDDVTLLLGDGTGGFSEAAASPFPVGDSRVSLVTADLDGDGVLDVATANGGSDNVTILLGQ